ncbi:MAG: Na(+)/H(+) antiporter subunit B [Opitutae bacterium]|nr:Na(+)/H(+) antiporter subunit B [Opitutae bacterium]
MKRLGLLAVILFGALLVYGTTDFPDWGDPSSPAATHLSPYYIQHSLHDTAVPNIVTAVLADYRGYDTMFETAVIFTAGLACLFLLRVFITPKETEASGLYRHRATGITLRIEQGGRLPQDSREFERIDSQWVPYDLIIRKACRLVIPFIQLFALYVVAHGHHSPGGGFQGGVIFGAAVILFAISQNMRTTLEALSEKRSVLLAAGGVLLYVGTGALCLLLGAQFLDYAALAGLLGVDPIMARSHGILIVEIGVAVAVMAVMVSLYYNLATVGRLDEGL